MAEAEEDSDNESERVIISYCFNQRGCETEDKCEDKSETDSDEEFEKRYPDEYYNWYKRRQREENKKVQAILIKKKPHKKGK